MDYKEKSFYLEEVLGLEGRKYKHENHEDDDGVTGIYKDGKLIFTEDQLNAIILWSDFKNFLRSETMWNDGFGKIFDDFFSRKKNNE